MKKKSLTAVLACITLAAVLMSGCSKKEAAPFGANPAKKRVMFVSIVTGGVAWGSAQKGFEDALKKLDWEGQYVSPMQANNTADVVNLLETAVTNNADAILGVILDAEQVVDVFTRAREKKIAIITCNTYTTPQLQDSWIGTDPVGMGKAQAQAVLDNFSGDNITLAYIQTLLTVPTQNQQYAAMKEVILEKYPNAVFVQDQCDSNAQIAADKCAALKKSYPDLNVIVCADGYGASGVANFIDSENYKDEIAGIGIDDSTEMLGFVKRGVMRCTIAQDFYTMGYQGVMMAQQVLEGKKLPFDNDSGTITITADKVDAHLALLKERGLVNQN
ncbi:MAG: substrate-binding domain-containing protein [Treponema sp.]|jgi:ABC-type sugar transport system substrate-binding protein|nr:substrate-binding domain-containing protein [Treponema sp.]